MKIGKNQYLLTRRKCFLEYNRKLQLGNYTLYLGEDCRYTMCSDENNTAVILGYAIDSEHIDLSEEQLGKEYLKSERKNRKGFDSTYTWGGRWILIALINEKLKIYHDASGLKQIMYDINLTDGDVLIASQARYIAQIMLYDKDLNAEEYLKIAKKNDKEYSFPLDASLYKEVKRLLPNHVIIEGKKIERKWINGSSKELGYKESIEQCNKILTQSMEGVSRKFPLAVTITAGLDSRLVLTSCNRIMSKVRAFTLQYNEMDDLSEDICIAKEICDEVQCQHEVLKCEPVSELFWNRYNEHSENAHKYWAQMEETILKNNLSQYIWVKGSGNEIVSKPNGNLKNNLITSSLLCRLYNIPETKFSIKIINDWIINVKDFSETINIPIIDLFYWEHRMGSWLAECLNEADCVGETFTPFSNRSYLAIVNSVEYSKKIPPKNEFFSGLLRENGLYGKYLKVNPSRYKSLKSKISLLIKYKLPKIYALLRK